MKKKTARTKKRAAPAAKLFPVRVPAITMQIIDRKALESGRTRDQEAAHLIGYSVYLERKLADRDSLNMAQIQEAIDTAAMLAQRQLQRQAAMSPADVQALIRKTIIACLDRDEAVQREHLLMANVPAPAIDMYFSRILLAVIRERQAQRRQEGKDQ